MSEHPLSVVRQCRLLEVPRSSFYYRPAPVSAEDLDLMRRIDAIHLDYPFLGSRRVQDELDRAGLRVNRKKIRRLMRTMGIAALYPKPRTSTPASGHRIYPYLLRDVAVTRPNQVWASDITYIPMAHGFMYLVAVLDWFSRRVLSWELSNTMDVAFCVAALEEALERCGSPDVFNSDQGSQYTSEAFTGVLGVAPGGDQHGWPGPVLGQHLHRASVAQREVRGRLSAGLREPVVPSRGPAELLRVLHRSAAACVAARAADARRGVFRGAAEPGGGLRMTTATRSPGRPNVVRPVDAQRRGSPPFFLLPAMSLPPARPRWRRHPQGPERSGGGGALPSTPGTGILFPSRRKQENQPQMALFATPGAPDDPSQEPAQPAKTLVSEPVQNLGSTSSRLMRMNPLVAPAKAIRTGQRTLDLPSARL